MGCCQSRSAAVYAVDADDSGEGAGGQLLLEQGHAGWQVTSDRDELEEFAWVKGEAIGSGSSGQVFLCLNQKTGRLMAVKEVPFDPTDTQRRQRVQTEITLLRQLQHPNIVRYLGTDMHEGTLCILTEWVSGGALTSVVEAFGPLAESVAAQYIYQLVQGLVYLHDQGIVHRDIK
ncbi:NPK1, partial [Symbiodinium sp. KB8]